MFAPTLDQSAVKLAFPNTATIPDLGAGCFSGILRHGPILCKHWRETEKKCETVHFS